ncbi:protein spire homolog 1 isoform X2 [Gadus morhua]|uniref:protein spire homolog 1 isoform X2 n=1 Tax=Gadus morhua TaxID=8049 RepID=UPI0011B748BD|nr:protein spire homolog 1-like isoform X2 [Gadus morhua]
MAEDDAELIRAALQRDQRLLQSSSCGCTAMDGATMEEKGEDLSLEAILALYNQPINEEQAWAVCYQCCSTLARGPGRRTSAAGLGTASVVHRARKIQGLGDVIIQRDGLVRFRYDEDSQAKSIPCRSTEVIESLGIMVYNALDYGLKETEERELSAPLEQLINHMINMAEAEKDACYDEGYEATEEDEEAEDEPGCAPGTRCYRDLLKICTSHLPGQSDAPIHYQAVCRALYSETKELRTFLEKIRSAKENLRKMEGDSSGETGRDLDELQNSDWARCWVQVMRGLRDGVKLKKVHERRYDPLPIEYQLTPYEMLMDDIRSQRFKLRKVMVNGDIPPKLKKSAHEVILDFIRSRPPLNPASARKLKPQAQAPPTLHERILEEIKAERKLRPVSPDMIRRGRLDDFSPYMGRRSSSTLSLLNAVSDSSRLDAAGSQSVPQRKRLLKAPSLAELDSSDSDEEAWGRRSASSSSMATSVMDDTSPEMALGNKTPPMFLPISSTPQPERRKQPQHRRHSIEKETPTNVRLFQPPTKKNSKSLEEFCFPVECLSLTVEEVMHIRQVLVKAELEKFQQYKDVYNAMKKGKLCFCCRTKRFSFFTWSYTCQFCKRPVCSNCCKKMRLPSKPYSSLPIYSIGSTNTLPRDRLEAMAGVAKSMPVADGAGPSGAPPPATASTSASAKGPPSAGMKGSRLGRGRAGASPEKTSQGQSRHSLQKTMSKLSKHGSLKTSDDLELPPELTEDWATMEVCVDCKKFIHDIISSSKHSLSLATKRARLKRKTQSFYLSSPKGREEYRPSERTINEI